MQTPDMSNTSSAAPPHWRATEVLTSAIGETSHGLVMAASSERGLCSVILGYDPDALRENLRQRFPAALLIDGSASSAAAEMLDVIVRQIEAPTVNFDLPLDICGTDFQRQVWQALLEIPMGETTNYKDLARSIGMPSAVRAVGTACGANRLAVVVPCHRVLSSSGELSGYRWGLKWKQTLLEKERLAGVVGSKPTPKKHIITI